MYYLSGKTSNWEVVIGLEIHAQVKSNTKLFSRSLTEFGANTNAHVSLVDAAFPGMLPVLNEFCVEQAVKAGFGIQGKINKKSAFDRKNYFYPDLPSGYQISQFYHPIVSDGFLEIELEDKTKKKIRIERIHLEQDAGKSIHDQSKHYTFIDLNRSGIALIEIVSAPEIRSPHEAVEYVKKLRSILRYLGVCDGDMEKGSLRCDVNVSVMKEGEKKLGTRCEIKNLNSTRNIMHSIEIEALRQIEIIEGGGSIIQETRLFDPEMDETRSMRSKEDATDYRYFPDPDLLPIELDDEYINRIKENLPELAEQKISRYVNDYGLSDYDAGVLTAEKDVAIYFDKVVSLGADPKISSNWIISELFGYLNKASMDFADSKVTPEYMTELVKSITSGVISGKIAKVVFEECFESGISPTEIIKSKGLVQISDTKELESIIDSVLLNNPKSVEDYRSGKDKLFGFFVGETMKLTKGRANPNLVNDILKSELN